MSEDAVTTLVQEASPDRRNPVEPSIMVQLKELGISEDSPFAKSLQGIEDSERGFAKLKDEIDRQHETKRHRFFSMIFGE